jgi:ribosomal protein S12 methylthiotransferase accessory factor
LEEAILHGLFEVIERDAFLVHWYGGLEQREIDLGRIADRPGGAAIAAMIDRARLCGYTVHAYDTRADLPVPVVTAVGVRDDGDLGALVFGAGASLDPVAAVASAFAEIMTYVPLMRRRTAPLVGDLRAMVSDYSLVKELRDHSNLFCLPEMARYAGKFTEPAAVSPLAEVYKEWDAVRPRHTDLLADVEYLRDLIVEAGSDIVVVDQTAPEQEARGLANVRVIVPGLLPIDFGWSRQRALRSPRLLTAPRRAGLLDRDLTEAELHRVPHPFP